MLSIFPTLGNSRLHWESFPCVDLESVDYLQLDQGIFIEAARKRQTPGLRVVRSRFVELRVLGFTGSGFKVQVLGLNCGPLRRNHSVLLTSAPPRSAYKDFSKLSRVVCLSSSPLHSCRASPRALGRRYEKLPHQRCSACIQGGCLLLCGQNHIVASFSIPPYTQILDLIT